MTSTYTTGYDAGVEMMKEWANDEEKGRQFAVYAKVLYVISRQSKRQKHKSRAKTELAKLTSKIFQALCKDDDLYMFANSSLPWPKPAPWPNFKP